MQVDSDSLLESVVTNLPSSCWFSVKQKSSVWWYVWPCSLIEVNWCCLHVFCFLPASCWVISCLVLQSLIKGWHIILKSLMTFNELHSSESQKVQISMASTGRIPNPAMCKRVNHKTSFHKACSYVAASCCTSLAIKCHWCAICCLICSAILKPWAFLKSFPLHVSAYMAINKCFNSCGVETDVLIWSYFLCGPMYVPVCL
jgi:hypothetical protein